MSIPGYHRYGVSGTPLDRGILNDLKLVACTGSMVVEVTNDELITAGWSATPIVHFHKVPHPTMDLWDSSYPDAVDLGLVHHEKRNEKIIEVVGEGILEGRSSLVIVNRIEHGEILEKMAADYRIPSLFVQGKSDMEKRFEALDWLRQGRVCAVIATPIFDEGVDVPALDSVVLACGGASHVKLLQRVGRGLRKKEGRNIMHVHDFTDSCNKFLSKHAERRRGVYEKENFTIQED